MGLKVIDSNECVSDFDSERLHGMGVAVLVTADVRVVEVANSRLL